MKETTTQRNLYNWNNDEEYRKRIASNLGDKLGANLHDFSYNIDCNENCKYYKNCKNKDNKNLLKNKWGYCKEYENSWHKSNIIFMNCKCCNNMETPHKFNNKTKKFECQVCNGNYVYNFYEDKFIKINIFEKRENKKIRKIKYKKINSKNHSKILICNCNICQKETPHKYNKETNKYEC